jgi:hypothetical protein
MRDLLGRIGFHQRHGMFEMRLPRRYVSCEVLQLRRQDFSLLKADHSLFV